ncbi:MAG: acyltransferase [Candidatus Nanopelagicales bacterium]
MPEFRILRWSNVVWIIRNRAWNWYYLVRYWRFLKLEIFGPSGVQCLGFVFLGKDVELSCRKGYGRIVIYPWVHLGDGNQIRAHEGTVTIGAKTVFGQGNTINAYLDIAIGSECVISDSVYMCDFDHRTDSTQIAIRRQGIVKSPVVIGDDVWIGTKVSILRGTQIGSGSVVGANSVVKGEIPQWGIAVGVPARVIRLRSEPRPSDLERVRHEHSVRDRTERALHQVALHQIEVEQVEVEQVEAEQVPDEDLG